MSNQLERTRRNLPAFFQDPFRSMNEWFRSPWYDPNWAGLTTMREMDFSPDFDVKETKDGYVVKGDVPGMKESDIDVQVTGNQLRISGKRETEKEEKGETYYSSERTFGSFARTFTLPDVGASDKVRAELTNGVLQVFVPRNGGSASKKIAVKAG